MALGSQVFFFEAFTRALMAAVSGYILRSGADCEKVWS